MLGISIRVLLEVVDNCLSQGLCSVEGVLSRDLSEAAENMQSPSLGTSFTTQPFTTQPCGRTISVMVAKSRWNYVSTSPPLVVDLLWNKRQTVNAAI